MFKDRGRRVVDSMRGGKVEVKSKVPIFVKDLGIVVDEGEGKGVGTPMGRRALELFERGVEMGLGEKDDSEIWKVHEDMMVGVDEVGENVFEDGNVVEVGSEPSHNVVLDNLYTRVMYVAFGVGKSTLPHIHQTDSVYVFLSLGGAKVMNMVKGVGCKHDFMEFGEVRYGVHSRSCPLVHRITCCPDSPVNCFDVEVKSPPPLRGGEEVESIEGHELVKVREKVRVFKLVLRGGEEYVRNYDFFHVVVCGSDGEIMVGGEEGGGWREETKKGTAAWSAPTLAPGIKYKNVGDSDYLIYVVQFREGWKAEE